MSSESLYFSLIVSHGPKWLLMTIVVVVLLVYWRQTSLGGNAKRLAWTGLGLYTLAVVAMPLLYGWLRWRMVNTGMDLQAVGHAFIGGLLTLLEFAGILLLGIAVAIDRRAPR